MSYRKIILYKIFFLIIVMLSIGKSSEEDISEKCTSYTQNTNISPCMEECEVVSTN